MRFGWTIFRYLIGSVLPFFISSWLLLSVVLFVQQASRFSDIFFSANIPPSLIWQLSFALIPNVIAFTCPMAALVGVIIGLTKMQADSELVAIRAAGMGNFGILLPLIALGVLLSAFAFFVNLKGVPFAAGIVRQVALRTALHKLESPIEPGAFNTELAGFTIYVKDGDLEHGTWKNIFIHHEDDSTNTTRLITSANGRIDYSNENSELVLEDAVATTLTGPVGEEKVFSERIGEVRYAVRTKRSEIVERLNKAELTPEELGLSQLADFARTKEGRDRIEAELLWQRRIMLSVSPLIFCLFGAAFVLRYRRASRGFAVFSALLSLIAYYLLAFFGEQMARTGKINVFLAGVFPIAFSVIAILWLNFGTRFHVMERVAERLRGSLGKMVPPHRPKWPSGLFRDVTTGLRDFDIIVGLSRYYLLSLSFLAAVFLIFTAFELWKFAGTFDNGVLLLTKYLFYLLPFIYLQLSPSSLMIAALATYVIKSRQNEIVTWTAAGQSVYRLLMPCIAFMVFFGFVNWQIQERILPRANVIQDELRTLIRNRGEAQARPTRAWTIAGPRIYTFELDEDASDNASCSQLAGTSSCSAKNLSIFDFGGNNAELQSVYRSTAAVWENGELSMQTPVDVLKIDGNSVSRITLNGVRLAEATNPLGEVRSKPSHLNADEIKKRLSSSGSESEHRSLAVALQKKYTTPFLPFAIALFTAPFALSLSRKGKAATIGYAVGLWLFFMGFTSVFEQLGTGGTIGVPIAVWGPLGLFALLGVYLLSKVRT